MSKPFSDFVDVQLSAAGLALTGEEGALHISNGRLAYRFAPGSTTRVLTSEWTRVLSRETRDGQALLEAVVAPAAPPRRSAAAAPIAPATTPEPAAAEDSSPSTPAKGNK